MTKPVYQQWHDGEPHVMDPQREMIKLACCDCGLVHDLHLTVGMKPTTIRARLTKRS